MTNPPPTFADAHRLLHLVQQGDLDEALAAGLMAWTAKADNGLDEGERALMEAVCRRLRTAWAARERYQRRQERLQRREHERRERRATLIATPAATLPTAAAILARARARARAGVAPQ